jgi:hypothetical protein
MGKLFILTSIGFIMAICFLVLYFVGTFFAIIGSIVMSPMFWGLIVIVLVIRYYKRKN